MQLVSNWHFPVLESDNFGMTDLIVLFITVEDNLSEQIRANLGIKDRVSTRDLTALFGLLAHKEFTRFASKS